MLAPFHWPALVPYRSLVPCTADPSSRRWLALVLYRGLAVAFR
ncbi:hypothetical protein ACWEO2_25935 [Nocardia sp. NPDC004278]